METVLNNGFCEMSQCEMLAIDGGGWLQAGAAFLGGILVAATPAACFAGPGVGAASFGFGCTLLDWACDNV